MSIHPSEADTSPAHLTPTTATPSRPGEDDARRRLASLLHKWRVGAGLSISGLAVGASVSKATISRWESGSSAPRLEELAGVLTSLGVSPAGRDEALSLISAPRAARALRRKADEQAALLGLEAAPPPAAGQLLRAMRLRRRLTLDQVAGRLGVRASTLCRWERGENSPSRETLRALCDLLQAHPREREALAGAHADLGLWPDEQEPGCDELERELDRIEGIAHSNERTLLDLQFLVWQAAVWRLVQRKPPVMHLLVQGWTRYATWLSWDGRREEAMRYARGVLDWIGWSGQAANLDLATIGGAVHISSLPPAHDPPRSALAGGVEFLQSWLPFSRDAVWRAQLLRGMAQTASAGGWIEEALLFSERARRAAVRGDHEPDRRICDLVHAETLVRAGRPAEALGYLKLDPAAYPLRRVMDLFQLGETYAALGDRTAAHGCLSQACDLAEAYHFSGLEPRVELLARSL